MNIIVGDCREVREMSRDEVKEHTDDMMACIHGSSHLDNVDSLQYYTFFGAFENGSLVGFATIKNYGAVWHLVFVKPEFRGQGLAD